MVRNEGHVRGELSEFKVASDLIENGCRVSYTHGEYPYDLIADLAGELLKVQVKTAKQFKDRENKYMIRTAGYTAENVDLFAGYIPGRDEMAVFYVPFEDAGQNASVTYTSREELSEHNASNAKFGENHTFEEVVKR